MSLNENEEFGNDDGEFTNTVDKELIDSIINEPLVFDNLDIEEDVNDLDDIKNMCEHYAKHLDSDDSIKNRFEYQFFECICVMAYEHVAEGSTVKNDIKWDSLAGHFINVLNNYPMKVWWREGILKFLPAAKVPAGVLKVAERIRVEDKLSRKLLLYRSRLQGFLVVYTKVHLMVCPDTLLRSAEMRH